MKRSSNRLTVIVAGVGLLAAACASGSGTMASKTPEQLVAERQQLMKQHGDSWKNIQDSAKANNLQGVATNADTMNQNAKKIVALFPAGSMTDKSKAKPEIWQKFAEFEGAAKKLETESARLRDTARTGNAQATNEVIKDFGRTACGACHTPFRVPPPRQG
ncbi:MAG: cytochrome c [Candidatus Rokubacteria bacterium]|nr:cytochrome c [Candidatus Rokubacteria bacterium]